MVEGLKHTVFEKPIWARVEDSNENFDLYLLNYDKIDIGLLENGLASLEKMTKSIRQSFSRQALEAFKKFFNDIHNPDYTPVLKYRAYFVLSKWVKPASDLSPYKNSPLKHEAEKFWDILFCAPLNKRLDEWDSNGRIVPENFNLWWNEQLKCQQQSVEIWPEDKFKNIQKSRQEQAKKLSREELRKRAARAPRKAVIRYVSSKQRERNEEVSEYAKRRAAGICELCNCAAPFFSKDGTPYLESHHIVWLSKGGEDAIENTVALCPNCHRKMHVLDFKQDRLVLTQKVK